MLTTPALGSMGAVLLAGGTGRRLGGVDKAAVLLGGRTLLDRALETTAGTAATVVVGPERATPRPVSWAREDPPGGGPGAGLLAGAAALPPGVDTALLLAVDMPGVTTDTLARLAEASAGCDGAVLVDVEGRRQLAAVLDRRRLVAFTGDTDGAPVHRVLAGLDLAEVAGSGPEVEDIDTWRQLDRHHTHGGAD